MINNPFSSKTFIKIWKKHFKQRNKILKFNFLEGVSFYKSILPNLYVNAGKNLTKGNYYSIVSTKKLKNSVFLIYDVPTYFKIENDLEHSNSLRIYKSFQYKGFLISLKDISNITEYLQLTFGKNSRMKMRRYQRRLDACFDISTKMFFGTINKEEYDFIFNSFMFLLKRRYTQKQISYNNMHPQEWAFYKEVAYPLILENKASFFVVYDQKKPIAITYNYHSEDTIFDAITVFDIDYVKFNIGYVNNLKLIEWSLDNDIKRLDLSKGYFDYKKRMCNHEYNFDYHILYDKNSVFGNITAFIVYMFFELKSYLRAKKFNEFFHKLMFFLKNEKEDSKQFEVIEFNSSPDIENLTKIDFDHENYSFLTRPIYDFLFKTTKHKSQIEVFKINDIKEAFLISSESLWQKIILV